MACPQGLGTGKKVALTGNRAIHESPSAPRRCGRGVGNRAARRETQKLSDVAPHQLFRYLFKAGGFLPLHTQPVTQKYTRAAADHVASIRTL